MSYGSSIDSDDSGGCYSGSDNDDGSNKSSYGE